MRPIIIVNGKRHEIEVEPSESLLSALRNRLGLTGTKKGCGEGYCGACTVLIDGKPVNSCIVLAVEADGKEVITIEGVSKVQKWRILQEKMVQRGAVQCGYCSPGMILTALSVLDKNPDTSEEELKRALAGNLCRCGNHHKTLEAALEYKEEVNV